SIKNDGHYFCRAGGNRPDGLNEPVTFKLIIPFLLIISYFMSSISVAIMSFVLYVIIRRRIGKDFFSEIKMKRLKKEDIMGLEHVI
ncbi:cytosine permease, partial [Escherichia coli]|uniref:cytosine permease n=1 Tax=Escherichia coli TaxID=562 RepID=UPI00201F8AA4